MIARSPVAGDTAAVDDAPQQAIREGLELFSRGEYEASLSKLAGDQVWWIDDGLAVRCENFADRERAWRAAGLDPELAA